MRVFLLPISTRRTLLYCERAGANITTSAAGASTAPSRSYLDRITVKANTTWTEWERAESGWKKTLTVQGNKILRRIPYEEWGLKTVPALTEGRKKLYLEGVSTRSSIEKEEEEDKAKVGKGKKVDIVFPGQYLEENRVEGILGKLVERGALHRKRLWWSIVGMPISAPFALIPIIPNIPFFYLCFRAYSHWKALSGSKHLQFLLSLHNDPKTASPLFLRPNVTLDALYTAGLMHPSRSLSRSAPSPTTQQTETVSSIIDEQSQSGKEEVMVLQKWNGKLIAEKFEIPEMEVEIERAVEQVEGLIEAERSQKAQEAEKKAGNGNGEEKGDKETVIAKGLKEEKEMIERLAKELSEKEKR